LVKYTDAVKQVTGDNGKYYKDRFDEAVANNDQYTELASVMKEKGFPKALIPYFQEEYPKHIKNMRRFPSPRRKRNMPKVNPDDDSAGSTAATTKKPAKRVRKKS